MIRQLPLVFLALGALALPAHAADPARIYIANDDESSDEQIVTRGDRKSVV